MSFKIKALLILPLVILTGCITDVWTGANLVYERHNLYKKVDNFQLGANASRALYHDRLFKRPDCALDLAVINNDILLSGHVPTVALRQEAQQRIASLQGYRRFFNQVAVGPLRDSSVKDHWITAKICSNMITDGDIEPNDFKVVTSDGVVYLMGDVQPEQAKKVILISRKCAGVKRVVTLMKYVHLSDKP